MGAMNAITASHATANRVLRHPETTTATAARNDLQDGTDFQNWLFSAPDRGNLVDPLGAETMTRLSLRFAGGRSYSIIVLVLVSVRMQAAGQQRSSGRICGWG